MNIEKITELKYGNTRCYCINNKLLVDTDWAGTLNVFFKSAKEKGIDISEIRYLFITHFHPDHMGIAENIAELGIKIIVFEEQKDYIHASDYVFKKDKYSTFIPIKESSITVLPLSDSRQFLLNIGIKGEVIHTPGHSDDSISLLLDDGTAIVGDLPPFRSIQGYDDKILEESWRKIFSHTIRTVKFGHFPDEIF